MCAKFIAPNSFGSRVCTVKHLSGNQNRLVILHYHLFKNAGSSVDKILKRNIMGHPAHRVLKRIGARILKSHYPDRWVTAEFPAKKGNNTHLVEEWLRDNPSAVAFSSHSMQGPIPKVEDAHVVSMMLFRDPIERIRSAFLFDRLLGNAFAKDCKNIKSYVRNRLAIPGDGQCRNFQTRRLANLVPGSESDLERAKAALDLLSVAGRVEAFGEFMERLAQSISDYIPNFTWNLVRANASRRYDADAELDEETKALLKHENADDYALLEALAMHERHSAEIPKR